MFSIGSFDLTVMYLVLFVGYFVTFITTSQYIGYAIMLLSLMGIYVIQIGLASKSSMLNSFSKISVSMMSVSSVCTLLTIYLIMLNSITNMNSKKNFSFLSHIVQIILFIQIAILLSLNMFKHSSLSNLLNMIEVFLSIVNLYLVYDLRSMNKNFTTDDCQHSCPKGASS